MTEPLAEFQQQLGQLVGDATKLGADKERFRIVEILRERAAPNGSQVQAVLDEIIAKLSEESP